MATYELVHNIAGDVVGTRQIEAVCRHGRAGEICPYCKECGENEVQDDDGHPWTSPLHERTRDPLQERFPTE